MTTTRHRQGLRTFGWLRGLWVLDLTQPERDALLTVLAAQPDPAPFARIVEALTSVPPAPGGKSLPLWAQAAAQPPAAPLTPRPVRLPRS